MMASTAANRSGPLPSATSRISAATGARATPIQKSTVSSCGLRLSAGATGAGMGPQPTELPRLGTGEPGHPASTPPIAPSAAGGTRPPAAGRGQAVASSPSEENTRPTLAAPVFSAFLVCGPPWSSELNEPALKS